MQQKNKTEISKNHPGGRPPQFPSLPSTAALCKERGVNRILNILQRVREKEKVWAETAKTP